MAKLQDRAMDRANDVRPYIERAFKDERVREDVKSAIMTAREIYGQLMGERNQITAAAARVATDKEIHESLRDAIDDLRDAADRIQGKSNHAARNTTLLMTGIVLGILFNPLTGPGTRRWLQDKIFGEGEEFEYRQDNAKKRCLPSRGSPWFPRGHPPCGRDRESTGSGAGEAREGFGCSPLGCEPPAGLSPAPAARCRGLRGRC